MKRIRVGKEHEAYIDDEDYDLVSQYTWWVFKDTNGHGIYANGHKGYKDNGQPDRIFMHQLIMDLRGVDHIDGDGLNNVRSNLRAATSSQNQANGRKRASATGYKGVSYTGAGQKKWKARINFQYKRTFLGVYATAEEAAHAYDSAAKEMYGEFAVLNFPESI